MKIVNQGKNHTKYERIVRESDRNNDMNKKRTNVRE